MFCRVAVVPLTAANLMNNGHRRVCLHTGPDVQVDSPDFWRSGYHARSSSEGGGAAAPAFLLPLLDSILAAGKARVLLRHEQATAAALPAAAGHQHGRSAAAVGSATGGPQHAERGLSQLCQERLRAALLAQLQAARSGSSGTLGTPLGIAAGGAQGHPAAQMRAAAAAHCLAPALSEPAGRSVGAAQNGTAAADAVSHAEAKAGCWAQLSSSWSASLQQVTACLPPLLPLPPPPHSLTLSSSSSQGGSLQRLSSTAPRSPIVHASAEQLLGDCVLGAVRWQVGACCTALPLLSALLCGVMTSDTRARAIRPRWSSCCNMSRSAGCCTSEKPCHCWHRWHWQMRHC